MKTIDNPLDVDLKRLFNKARRKLKFPRKDSLKAKDAWSENLIRIGIGKQQSQTKTIGSSDHGQLSIDSKSRKIKKPDESDRGESSPTEIDDDDGGGVDHRDKYIDSFEVKKVEESIRNGIDKLGKQKESQDNGDYKVQKKYQTRQNKFQKISEDKYLETIRQNADYEQKKRSKYKNVLKAPRKTVKIKNPERIIQKINNLNENVYNEDKNREAPFESLKPTSQLESMVVRWGKNSKRNKEARQPSQKIKLRRRKKKKAGWPVKEQKEEPDNKPEKMIVLQKDFQEKVKKPLKTEWNAIFQRTTYPRKEYLESSSTTTTSVPPQSYRKSIRGQKSNKDPEHSVLRKLVEKYCQFENSLGIMKLCESQQLSTTRKHLEKPFSQLTVMKSETNTEKTFLWKKQEKKGSFVENVKSAFNNIFSYF